MKRITGEAKVIIMDELTSKIFNICERLDLNPRIVIKFKEECVTFKHKYEYSENEINDKTNKVEFKTKSKNEDVYIYLKQFKNFQSLNIDAYERGIGYPKEIWEDADIEKTICDFLKIEKKKTFRQLSIFDF